MSNGIKIEDRRLDRARSLERRALVAQYRAMRWLAYAQSLLVEARDTIVDHESRSKIRKQLEEIDGKYVKLCDEVSGKLAVSGGEQ